MPDFYNDGNIPFGSVVVTLSGTPYVAEDIDFDEPSTSIIRRSEINVPNGAVHIKDIIKAPMTLQLASNVTPIPARFAVVSVSFRGASKDFVVTRVGQPYKQDDIRKIKVEITEKLN